MNKQALIEHGLGALKRNTGSVSGPSAPWVFRRFGGPLTGTLVQSGLGAAAGYGAGKFVNWLTDRDTRLPEALALGGATAGPLLNGIQLASNRHFGLPLNAGPEAYQQQREKPAEWAKAALFGMDAGSGQPVNSAAMEHAISSDPTMDPITKVKLLAALAQAQQQEGDQVHPSTLMSAATGLGVGYLMGSIVSRFANWFAGGISPTTSSLIRGAGAAGGLAHGMGML